MLTKLMEQIKNLFAERTYQDDVEYYVTSKNPKSTAEVEYWVQYYTQNKHNGGGWAL